ncbi:MAG: Cytochrome oxidase, cbb3-type, subunit [Acidobacteriota bacterium]|jgi:mono/diheme cytochrome c family protein|nr:Cytochrome oxidase, cbb3-type, subunit [Acidobacteriota bacterium]
MLAALAVTAVAAVLAGCPRKNLTTPELYEAYCTRCHGDRGQGDPRSLTLYPHADLLVSPMTLRGDRAAIRERIAEGYGPMPGFKRRLTPQEVERLVDYTLQLSRTPKETP